MKKIDRRHRRDRHVKELSKAQYVTWTPPFANELRNAFWESPHSISITMFSACFVRGVCRARISSRIVPRTILRAPPLRNAQVAPFDGRFLSSKSIADEKMEEITEM